MSSFLFSVNIVIPIFLIAALGYFLSVIKLWNGDFIKTANSVCFKIFLPVLLFYNISHSDFKEIFNLKLILYILILVTVIIGLAVIIVPLIVHNNRRRGVVIQALFRGNYLLLGVPLCQGMFGDIGAATASVLAAFVIPYFNVLATVILSVYSGDKIERPLIVFYKILKNPLIIGSVLGVIAVLSGVKFPNSVDLTLRSIKDLATPFALLILGGDFQVRSFARNIRMVSVTGLLRLVAVPALVIVISTALGFHGVEIGVLIAVFSTPVAVSSYVMTYEMGGDYELAGQLVVFTSLVSAFTIFLTIYAVKLLGLL